MKKLKKAELRQLIETKLAQTFGVSYKDASKEIMFRALSLVTKDLLTEKRLAFKEDVKNKDMKQVYYMSMEFLLGRSLKNHLYNMEMLKTATSVVKDMGYNIDDLIEEEPDAGLGNGGLGRLAAAYMDSLTSCGYPAGGFSIRYDYGIFAQKIVDGWQTELPDYWLRKGDVWLKQRSAIFKVKFGGRVEQNWIDGKLTCEQKDYTTIIAEPYDMNISGYSSPAVNTLRLWRAKAPDEIDMALFAKGEYVKAIETKALAESISKILYPADDHIQGKSLRLQQQYFFVSASVQSILENYLRTNETLDNLGKKVAIHINDTHPALCIPELMRILLDDHGYSWEQAWAITTEVISYTNHTVMQEALEKWPLHLFAQLLPRITQIVEEINKRYFAEYFDKYHGDWQKVRDNAVICNNQVLMANLCLVASHTVNGVSALHSEILKNDVFRDSYSVMEEKFTNVTNGITHRRWLGESNPLLTRMIADLIGDGFLTNPNDLEKLMAFKDDKAVLAELAAIKRKNKLRLVDYIAKENGVEVSPDAIFDVQVKRLHEYKRQLLNALQILNLYNRLKENPDLDITPRVFIFGAKAAGSYYIAKLTIRLLYMIGEVVNNDASIKGKLKVVFLENYRVSLAEIVMPASDISEQISIAGKEASGTGNMKFMINGAVTLGTMDGANVEIHERVGDDNIFIFGLLTEEVQRLQYNYSPSDIYAHDPRLQKIMALLRSGINGVNFTEIADYLTLGRSGQADPYMCFADFDSYVKAQDKVDATYKDCDRFRSMSLVNIAKAGFFAADRSVTEYAERIWNLQSIKSIK
ncbi:MAG: glycogen/starch/alpha-glucan phosphorylase [Bacillota bacterium]